MITTNQLAANAIRLAIIRETINGTLTDPVTTALDQLDAWNIHTTDPVTFTDDELARIVVTGEREASVLAGMQRARA